jgi:hypothetical protein
LHTTDRSAVLCKATLECHDDKKQLTMPFPEEAKFGYTSRHVWSIDRKQHDSKESPLVTRSGSAEVPNDLPKVQLAAEDKLRRAGMLAVWFCGL